MTRIGLLSDTHSYLDPALEDYFSECDEIWHAGDIGDWSVVEKMLSWNKPLRLVYGNIDDHKMRAETNENEIFTVDGMKIFMTHIGGNPGKYFPRVREIINSEDPDIFVCGHSHILRVIFDKKYDLLYLNPGAAGKHGFHQMRTALRFNIDNGRVLNMEVIELGLRGSAKPDQ